MEDKKKILLVFIVAIFLVLIVSATYAYFAVSTVNNFGTSTINAQAGGIGTVTLNGNNAQLNLSVTALDMVQGNSDITYYASSSGKTTTETEEVIGTASVTPSTDTNYYHCTYTLFVTHTGTNDMYNAFNHQTNNVYDYTNRSEGQIILTINGVDYDFYNAWPINNQISGEFYIKGNQTRDITASLRFVNDSDINQTYLAGTDISISISFVNNSLSCTVKEEPYITYVNRQNVGEITLGDEVSIGSEHFYVINPNDGEGNTVLLSKYNLLVGDIYEKENDLWVKTKSMNSNNTLGYGLQSESAKGFYNDATSYIGVVPFSGKGYWDNANCVSDGLGSTNCIFTSGLKSEYENASNVAGKTGYYSTVFPYVYKSSMSGVAPMFDTFTNSKGTWSYALDNGYTIAYYIEEYIRLLKSIGAPDTIVGRLMYGEETLSLASNIKGNWSYWLGSGFSSQFTLRVGSNGSIVNGTFCDASTNGVRPVIVVNTSDLT
jgi:hypothetical protein